MSFRGGRVEGRNLQHTRLELYFGFCNLCSAEFHITVGFGATFLWKYGNNNTYLSVTKVDWNFVLCVKSSQESIFCFCFVFVFFYKRKQQKSQRHRRLVKANQHMCLFYCTSQDMRSDSWFDEMASIDGHIENNWNEVQGGSNMTGTDCV